MDGPVILIASDDGPTAETVRCAIAGEFPNILVATPPGSTAEAFDRHRPEVLILAFPSVERAEHHLLELFRRGREPRRHAHRTLVLCGQDEVPKAYERCRMEVFDDYAPFRPPPLDRFRLSMAVHHAVRDLATTAGQTSDSAAFAAYARQALELESLLKARMGEGDRCVASAGEALSRAGEEIRAALEGFSKGLAQGAFSHLVDVRNAPGLDRAFEHLHHQSIETPLRDAQASIAPVRQWVAELREATGPLLSSLQTFRGRMEGADPVVLVVDDDPFQHQLVKTLLKGQGCRLIFAASGIEALNQLRKRRPDLILMDFAMPGMDGVQVTRRMKGMNRFADIPIIMITGNSEEEIVTASLEAGASDFMVKPLAREPLMRKMAQLLGLENPPAAPVSELSASDL